MQCGLNDVCYFGRGSFSYPSIEIVEGHVADESNKNWKKAKSPSLYLEENHQESCQSRTIPIELDIDKTYIYYVVIKVWGGS